MSQVWVKRCLGFGRGAVLAFLVLAACAPELTDVENEGAQDSTGQKKGDDNKQGGDGSQGGDDTGVPGKVCESWAKAGVAFPIEGPNAPPQLSSAVVSDGKRLWLSYSRRSEVEEEAGMVNFAQQIDCDGTPLGPLRLSSGSGATARQAPVVALSKGRVMVAWSENSEDGPSRTLVRYRILEADGTPLKSTDTLLDPVVGGEERGGTLWQLSLAGDDQGFVLAGAISADGVGYSRVVFQRVDRDGELVGESTLGLPEESGPEKEPSVALLPNGAAVLAWQADTGKRPVRHRSLPALGTEEALGPIARLQDEQGEYPRLAAGLDGSVWLAYISEHQLAISDLSAPAPQISTILSAINESAVIGNLAAGENGGALVYQSRDGTGLSSILVQRFWKSSTGALQSGTPIPVNVRAAVSTASGPDIAWLGGNRYFVTWVEGTSPERVLMGRFMELPGGEAG